MRGGYFGTRPFGVPGWHRWCSRAPSGRVAVCVRGRRPARSPSALRAFGSARRLEARPGPAAAHGHRGHALRCPPHRRRCVVVCGGQALPPTTDTAAMPSTPAALCRCVWRPGPAADHGHRGHSSGALHTGGAVSLCVAARPCRRPRTPRPSPPGPAAPSALRAHVVSCVADPGGRILIRTGGIVLREVSGKASPGPLQAFWSRGGYESMSGCDRASQAHTEAPGAVAPGALAAIRCEPSEPNATRSVAA